MRKRRKGKRKRKKKKRRGWGKKDSRSMFFMIYVGSFFSIMEYSRGKGEEREGKRKRRGEGKFGERPLHSCLNSFAAKCFKFPAITVWEEKRERRRGGKKKKRREKEKRDSKMFAENSLWVNSHRSKYSSFELTTLAGQKGGEKRGREGKKKKRGLGRRENYGITVV